MRQGRNPRGRVHYAGAIGCGRVSRCRLRLCGWVNRVVRRFRGVCGARGRKCERCATAGGLDWIPGCSWAANAAFKVDFAASRPGFGSNPGRVGATLGFLSITRSFTKRVALEGSRPSGEICFGCSCVLQSVDSKRVRRTRGVGRTGDGGVFTTARCAPEGLARTHLRPLFAVCGNRQPATCSFAKPTTPRWSICSARSWRKAACASSELRRWRGTKTAAIKA